MYGHGSSIALIIFVALFALRMLSSQRRRGRTRASARASSLADPPATQATAPAPNGVGASPGPGAFTGIAAGWLVDPTARHEKRYWSGSEWTEHVSDGGVPGSDPPPPSAGRDTLS